VVYQFACIEYIFKNFLKSCLTLSKIQYITIIYILEYEKTQDYLILTQVWGGTPSSRKRTFVHCNLRYSSSLFRTIVKYFITSITQCAVYPIIFLRRARRKCPLFRWRGSRTAYRSAETSHVPSFLPNFETETSYDFAKLETPWRESRERRSPHEGSHPDTHSVSAGWFVFPPATFLPR